MSVELSDLFQIIYLSVQETSAECQALGGMLNYGMNKVFLESPVPTGSGHGQWQAQEPFQTQMPPNQAGKCPSPSRGRQEEEARAQSRARLVSCFPYAHGALPASRFFHLYWL
jgi:hypothetical protein